jgi:hypothetical protein
MVCEGEMSRAVMQQALDALEQNMQDERVGQWRQMDDAVMALRAELAKPEPEPVAWMHPTVHTCISAHRHVYANGIPLYLKDGV